MGVHGHCQLRARSLARLAHAVAHAEILYIFRKIFFFLTFSCSRFIQIISSIGSSQPYLPHPTPFLTMRRRPVVASAAAATALPCCCCRRRRACCCAAALLRCYCFAAGAAPHAAAPAPRRRRRWIEKKCRSRF